MFEQDLNATPLADGINWRLNSDLVYVDPEGGIHVTPAGFQTDFASIPELARLAAYVLLLAIPASVSGAWFHVVWLLAVAGFLCLFAVWVAWVAPLLNNDDQLDSPATQHDHEYQTLGTNKFIADFRLFISMGATNRPMWKRLLVWFNVALFGYAAFRNDQAKAEAK